MDALRKRLKETEDKIAEIAKEEAKPEQAEGFAERKAAAIDAKTGAVLSYLKLGRGAALITPMAAAGMVYVVTDNGELIAIN